MSRATQADAATQGISADKIVSTDPPYYDNIGYADLSDFFYVWLRRSLSEIYPELFVTPAVPKAEELVATPYRHGSKGGAEEFFRDGMTRVFRNLAEQTHPAFPVTVYYAFKQVGAGWETFLTALLDAGFRITASWPMSTEAPSRMISHGTDALTSSVVLVLRLRDSSGGLVSRTEFAEELAHAAKEAEAFLTAYSAADRAQAAIGFGMIVFSAYSTVLDFDGKPMTVAAALDLIAEAFGTGVSP
jgi:putative DNA methylase